MVAAMAAPRRRVLRVWLIVSAMLAALLGPVGAGQAAVPKVDLKVEKYTLPNGLEVILQRDTHLPTVATNLWYHVGAANEGPGRTGFAHLFEHMMFQGSGHVPEGRMDTLMESVGAYTNASTTFDYTNYVIADLPSDQLERALWLESDRMGFLLDRLDASNLANQQAVVRNERRQNFEQAPYAQTYERIYQELFPPNHPYHGAVMGSHADIQAASLEAVRTFFKTYYVPNNATLAIAGNFDVARTKAWISKYFGTIPRGEEPPDPAIAIPRVAAEKRLVLTDDVELPMVTMAWLSPPRFGPGDRDAEVTAKLLAGGENSRLYASLVRDKKIAQEVAAYQSSARYPSVFMIQAVAKPGRTAKELEAAINAELAHQRSAGPSASDVIAARTGLVSGLVRGLESIGDFDGRADRLNLYNHYLGTPDRLNADIAAYEAIGRADVKSFVGTALRPSGRLVIHTVPGRKVLPPDPPAPPIPADTDSPPASAESWRNTEPGAGPAPTVPVPDVQSFALDNGMPVYLVQSHVLPVVTASLVSRYGSAMDPTGRPGLANFTASMLRQGTKKRGALEIAREVAGFGGVLDTTASQDGSWVTVAALAPQADRALGLAADVVRHPTFPKADIKRVRNDLLVGLRQQVDSPSTTASALMRAAVYGADHPYGHLPVGRAAGVQKVTRADLVRFHADAFTPTTTALVLAGDLTKAQAKALAEKAFGSWTGRGTVPPVPGPATGAKERVVLVDTPGATQTALSLGHPGLARSDPAYERVLVANRILGGLFSSRLMQNLREKHGYTYGVYSTLSANRGVGPFRISGSFETGATGASLTEIFRELRRIRAEKVTAEELRRGKDSVVRSIPTLFQTTPGSVETARDLFLFGLGTNYYDGLGRRIGPLTAGQVRAAAAKYIDPKALKIVAVGDRARIEPQLKRLNLGKMTHRTPGGAVVRPKKS